MVRSHPEIKEKVADSKIIRISVDGALVAHLTLQWITNEPKVPVHLMDTLKVALYS